MLDRPTNEMMAELLKSNHIDEYMKENQDGFLSGTAAAALHDMLIKKGLTRAEVIHRSEINEIYAYQIFAGKRIPSRDKLISICFGMELTLEETQKILKASGCAPLYPKNRRDSIIIFSVAHRHTVMQANEALYERGEQTL